MFFLLFALFPIKVDWRALGKREKPFLPQTFTAIRKNKQSIMKFFILALPYSNRPYYEKYNIDRRHLQAKNAFF